MVSAFEGALAGTRFNRLRVWNPIALASYYRLIDVTRDRSTPAKAHRARPTQPPLPPPQPFNFGQASPPASSSCTHFQAPTPLRGIFDAYAAFGGFHGATGGLDSKGLVKLCKESGIIAASFSMVDTDLVSCSSTAPRYPWILYHPV